MTGRRLGASSVRPNWNLGFLSNLADASGWDVRGGRPSNQGLRRPVILVNTPTGQVKPVACFTHPDLAPRGAVRRVGPRPDPTRSAHTDEPGGTAIRPGDRSRGSVSPYRAANQPTGGRQK